MTILAVPSLSPAGWISDPAAKADALLSYFFTSMYSQTLIYANEVSSLQYLLQQYGSDVNQLTVQIEKTLNKYLGRYYDLASVTVTNDVNDLTNITSTANISIFCSITENGQTYSIGNLLKVSNSKVNSISSINNG